MTELSASERRNRPISTNELQRRQQATRAAMEAAGLDVLVVCTQAQEFAGATRWLTDAVTFAWPVWVIFPRDDALTLIQHGAFGTDVVQSPPTDGVGRVLSAPAFPSAAQTSLYEAELAVTALAPYANARIGIVGSAQLSWASGRHLTTALPQATLVDASDLLDRLRAVKSPEEQELVRATAALQDAVLARTIEAIEPGRRESDVLAVARMAAQELGSEAGVFLSGADQIGVPAPIAPRHFQHRVLRHGDVLSLLIECDGPGGMYCELGRMCVLGEIPDALATEQQRLRDIQRDTVRMMIPGTPCMEIAAAHDALLAEYGLPAERRIHAHAQGYDLVERPLIRHDEPMTIEAGMHFACHPSYPAAGVHWWICDNWIIGPDGPYQRIHRTPRELIACGV